MIVLLPESTKVLLSAVTFNATVKKRHAPLTEFVMTFASQVNSAPTATVFILEVS